jgi:hypothetical protein
VIEYCQPTAAAFVAACGRAFAIVKPPDEDETERDKLCPACLTLPPAPQGTDDQPA